MLGKAEDTVNLVKRLTYRPELTGLARALGLRQVLRKLYYHWAAPGGILRLEVKRISAKFYVRTPDELRGLDGAGIGKTIEWGERHTLELIIDALHSGGVVYDVGANFGLYTVLLAKAMGERGQVIAFEPDARNHERLQQNLKLNAVTNVRCFRKALGDTSGKAEFYFTEKEPWGSSLLIRPGARKMSCEMVEVERGDRLAEVENLPIPRAVKIDVEGYEYAVLRGLQHTLAHPTCELVYLEIHPNLLPPGVTSDQTMGLLKSLGFSRIDIYSRGSEKHAVCYKAQR